MAKRIAAIVLIFICSTVAWMVLGATVFARTYDSDSRLRGRVASNWGAPQVQEAPIAEASWTEQRRVETTQGNAVVARYVEEPHSAPLTLERTRANVALALEHRQKGLLWYSTYVVDFAGEYAFRNTTAHDSVTLRFAFPTKDAVYDDMKFLVNGQPVTSTSDQQGVTATVVVPRGTTVQLAVGYRSQGLDRWSYSFGSNVSSVRDFVLAMRTNFADIDFAENMISPTTKQRNGNGWDLTWRYTNLVSGFTIGMVMPEKLQPGPLAGRISFFAPVSLLFFFLLMFVLTTLRGIELHPMNYFFLAAAFFSFHLLLAYLVDHVGINTAFIAASLVSVLLVVTYLRLVVGLDFAVRYAAPAQITYLVLFSYAFFFEGYAGLTVTIGSIISLFVVMQMTGRVRWAELFAASSGRPGARAGTIPA
ncbi:MAG TPA: inner membrane CreD family protein [Gemmatimonadaceae bacterium]